MASARGMGFPQAISGIQVSIMHSLGWLASGRVGLAKMGCVWRAAYARLVKYKAGDVRSHDL